MRVVVLGAAGGVGTQVVAHAAARGHEVVAGARRPEQVLAAPGVTAIAVDVRDAGALDRAVRGADAVISCVGVTKTSGGDVGRAMVPLLLQAMQAHGVERVVAVSGAGVTIPGDVKGLSARAISGLTRLLAKDLVQDKQGEHDLFAASSVAWTIVRPPRLVDKPGTGRYLLTTEAPGATAKPTTRSDVALGMLDLAENREWLHKAPFIVAG